MLHASQFRVSETWIVFKANEEPIPVVEGDVDCFVLMDAGSMYVIDKALVHVSPDGLPHAQAAKLLENGVQAAGRTPKQIYIPAGQFNATALVDLAQKRGIEVVFAEEKDLQEIVGPLRKGLTRRFTQLERPNAPMEEIPSHESGTEQRSPYAPIRLRGKPFWILARQEASAGRITGNGMVASQLHETIETTLVEPAIKLVGTMMNKGEMDGYIAGDVIARHFSYHDWVPMAAQYELCGRQIFDLHDRLTEMLLQTDVGECTLEGLHTPYEAFFVRFGTQHEIKMQFDENRWEFIDGAFVAWTPWGETRESHAGQRLKIAFSSVHEDGTHVNLPGYFFDFLPNELNVPVPDAITAGLERRLKKFADESTDNDSSKAIKAYAREQIEDSATVLRSAATLLINALFYLESIRDSLPEPTPGRDTPPKSVATWMQSSPSQRRTQRSNLSADGYAVVHMVGNEVANADQIPADGGVRSVRVHWRRGHWRMQAHGEHLALRKRIWIKPVLVGKDTLQDGQELKGHLYVPPGSTTDRVQ